MAEGLQGLLFLPGRLGRDVCQFARPGQEQNGEAADREDEEELRTWNRQPLDMKKVIQKDAVIEVFGAPGGGHGECFSKSQRNVAKEPATDDPSE